MLSKVKKGMLFGTMAAVLSLGVLGSAYAADADPAKTNHTADGRNGFGKLGLGGEFVGKENTDLLALLKLEAEELREALKAGKSLADVAEAQGVDKQEIVNLLLKQRADKLEKQVAAGKLTKKQADKLRESANERIEKQVEREHRGKKEMVRGFAGGLGQSEELLALLKMEAPELKEALKAGKSLASVAEGQGVDKQEVVELLMEQQANRLAAAVAAGKLTQEQADAKQAGSEQRIVKMVEGTFEKGRFFGKKKDGAPEK